MNGKCELCLKQNELRSGDLNRFECKNRIKFAVQQERLAHEAALKQQRQDLLKMFQRDREELIQDSKAELEALTTKLNSEHEVRREMEVQKSVEETQLSANEKINELIERIRILENELSDTDKIISEETEYVIELYTAMRILSME